MLCTKQFKQGWHIILSITDSQRTNNARPTQSLMGVGTTLPLALAGCTSYKRLPDSDNPRVNFIFEGIKNRIIGDYGVIGGGAAGQETDAVNVTLGTPSHTLHLARSQDFPVHAYAGDLYAEEYRINLPQPISDIVFFETPNDGAVFSVGSMAWVGALSHNDYGNDVACMTENVLRQFMKKTP